MTNENLHIDQLLKRLAEEGVAGPDEDAWQKMKTLLAEKPVKDKDDKKIFFIILVLLFFCIVTGLLMNINTGKKRASGNLIVSKITVFKNPDTSNNNNPTDIDSSFNSSDPLQYQLAPLRSIKNNFEKKTGKSIVNISLQKKKFNLLKKQDGLISGLRTLNKKENQQSKKTITYFEKKYFIKNNNLSNVKDRQIKNVPGINPAGIFEIHKNTLLLGAKQNISIVSPGIYNDITIVPLNKTITEEEKINSNIKEEKENPGKSFDTVKKERGKGQKNPRSKDQKSSPFFLPSHWGSALGIGPDINFQNTAGTFTGFSAGIYYNSALSKKFSIQPELQSVFWTGRGTTNITHRLFNYTRIDTGINSRYVTDSAITRYDIRRYITLQPDISVQYKLKRFSILAGAGFAFRLSINGNAVIQSYHDTTATEPTTIKQSVSFSERSIPGKTTFVLHFGAEYAFSRKWSLGFNYQLNKILSKNNSAYSTNNFPFGNAAFKLTLRYRFIK